MNLDPNTHQETTSDASTQSMDSGIQAVGHTLVPVAFDADASMLAVEPKGFFQKSIDQVLDCFSSILVKEARQSLKSYQFFGTYILLILAVIAWTAVVFAIGYYGRDRNISEGFGSVLLCGYLVILGLPLIVIVPFSAFRSLMREYEDGTIQLVSITTMNPYQIVIGKLSTAMLQMAIYLSVVAPCVAFVSMLDGVTNGQIFYGLGIISYGCFMMTVLGLLLAGASRSYGVGLATSTLFVLGLGGLFIGWWSFVVEVIFYSNIMNDFNSEEGWLIAYILIAFSFCTTMLALAAAASQISFATDNRSTWIRIAMFLQLPFFIGSIVMVSPVFANGTVSFAIIWGVFIGHYWILMGSFLAGESGEMSRRIQRGMPKTMLGKIFLSLLMPGPGRGYLFALACMFSVMATVIFVQANWQLFADIELRNTIFRGMPLGANETWDVTSLKSVILLSYPCFYLSSTYVIMEMIRRFSRFRLSGAGGPVLSLVVAVFVFFGITMLSVALTDWGIVYNSRYSSEGPLDLPSTWNWYLYLEFLAKVNSEDFGSYLFLTNARYYIPLVLFNYSITLLGIIVASRELKYQPMSAPQRVVEDIEEAREAAQQEKLAPGESIDEIFGVIEERPQSESE